MDVSLLRFLILGSKSPILTCIQLCLGAKETKTTREDHSEDSLSQFIKAGMDTALITIHLRNQGRDAFRHDVYGDTIIIERRIDQTSNGYKIKEMYGKVVESTRSEVVRIVNQFNIEIDNPCSIMDEEILRKFLVGSTPAEKV
jgi:chromosome segregation ATPase